MKILISISDSFCANFIKGQGRYLVDHGHEVIIVSGPGKEIDLLEEREPVKVIRVPFAREISPVSDFFCLLKIIKIVKNERPDIINAGNPKTGFLFSLGHLFFWKTPLIFTLRGLRSDTLSGLKKQIVLWTEKISCLFANKVIAISPSLKQHAVSLGLVSKEKCLVLGKGSSNGVNTVYFENSKETVERGNILIDKLNIPKKSFKFIFVGRVTKDKGIVELLDAFLLLLKTDNNLSLIIVGPIEKADPLPDRYYDILDNHPNIFCTGKLLDVRPVYSIADALVLYSYREGFGNVVIEASSMGIPTIVADIPGLKDTTEHKFTGLHVKPRNVSQLLEAMLFYVNNRGVSKVHGLNGAHRAREYFGNEIIWGGQLSLYNKLLK